MGGNALLDFLQVWLYLSVDRCLLHTPLLRGFHLIRHTLLLLFYHRRKLLGVFVGRGFSRIVGESAHAVEVLEVIVAGVDEIKVLVVLSVNGGRVDLGG